MVCGIIGNGEIGKAINHFYPKALIKDLDINEFDNLDKMSILHVCIPFTDEFINIVSALRDEYKPDVVIIHSTVEVGTTENLNKSCNNVVHSPCVGIHPYLADSFQNFTKYIGYDNIEAGIAANNSMESVGIPCKLKFGSRHTEASKIWSTTLYGAYLCAQKDMYEYCQDHNIDFKFAYNEWQRNYNAGYDKMGMPNVKKPIYKHIPGELGGHCIVPNLDLLDDRDTKKFIQEVNFKSKDF